MIADIICWIIIGLAIAFVFVMMWALCVMARHPDDISDDYWEEYWRKDEEDE